MVLAIIYVFTVVRSLINYQANSKLVASTNCPSNYTAVTMCPYNKTVATKWQQLNKLFQS